MNELPAGSPDRGATDAETGAATDQSSGFGAEVRLPRPPGVFRRWLSAHPRVIDGIIVGCYLFGCAMVLVFEMLAGVVAAEFGGIDADAAQISALTEHFSWPWMIVRALIVLTVALALAYRRRFPLAGLIAVVLTSILEQGLLAFPNSVALVFLLYAVPVYRSVAAGWIGYAIVVVTDSVLLLATNSAGTGLIGPSALVAEGQGPVDTRDAIAISIVNALWLIAILLIAINLGNRRRYVQALIDRAYQLAREREQQAALSAAAERSRIAREMHDIVAHSLSVVVTLSEAASVAVETQPKAAQQAMQRAAETGRSALVEMRRLLGVLGNAGDEDRDARTSPGGHSTAGAPLQDGAGLAPLSPQPGLSELHELIDGFRQAGLRVSLTESGVAAGDASHHLAVFRIVQEGLTNSLRYAGRGAEVQLTLRHSATETSIEVLDSGQMPGASRPNGTIPGSGRGLAGAAERARMFGGTLESGAHGSGWILTATIPVAMHQLKTQDD